MKDRYFQNPETGEVYKLEANEPWYKNPKTWFKIIGTASLLFGAGLLLYQNGKRLDHLREITKEQAIDAIKGIKPIIREGIIVDQSKKTGIMATATKLGEIMGVSAQQINKRLVSKGFAERLPSGDYILTDLGKQIGISTLKCTKYDHTFSNNEWDTSIIEYLFSKDELVH